MIYSLNLKFVDKLYSRDKYGTLIRLLQAYYIFVITLNFLKYI